MGAGAPQAMPVSTFVASKGDIDITLEYPAKVKSVQQVQVVARVPGTLEKKFFKEGSTVKEGQLLYRIDPAKYQAAYDAASAQLSIAEANAKQADRNWNRTEVLYAKNALSQREYDSALSAYESANAQVKAAEAALLNAKVDLGYTNVTATAGGDIGESLQDLGSYVGTAATNALLTTITQTNPIYAEFSIPDIDALKQRYTLKTGSWGNLAAAKLPAKIITPAGEAYDEMGVFDYIDTNVDAQTASIKARATFKNGDKVLLPGLFVRVVIEGLVQKDTFSIPQKAVMQDPLGNYVYVMSNNTAQKRPIVVGNTIANSEIIVNSGLNVGDIIILDNLNKLRPGAPVVDAKVFAQMMAAKSANASAGKK
jgi:membrane fusion protein (multidrug efflux system)